MKAPEDSGGDDRIHAEPMSSSRKKKTKKDTRRDTGFKRETDTDSQYIDYSYTYNPICLRCKMHRFCPKDRVLLVIASLEKRVSEGGAAAAALAYTSRLPAPILLECLPKSPAARLRYGSASRLRLDPPRIAPSEFDYRVPRVAKEFLPAPFTPVERDFDFAKRDPGGRGRSDFSTNENPRSQRNSDFHATNVRKKREYLIRRESVLPE